MPRVVGLASGCISPRRALRRPCPFLPALALVLALSVSWVAVAAAGVADQVGATFGLMLQDIVNAFPPVEGLVVEVDGGQIYMDLADKDGIRPGQEFTVFRKGEVFVHPVTHKPLGHFEQVLGYAQVERVLPKYSAAKYIPVAGEPAVQPEDGVRITHGRIRAAVAPTVDLTKAQADLRRVPFMIALGLDQTKRFQTVDPSTVRDLLLKEHVRPEELLVLPERVIAIGKMLEVAGWLVPVLIERSSISYLDVTWISAVTGMPLFSRRLPLTRADSASEQRFPWEPRPED